MKAINELREKQLELKRYTESLLENEDVTGANRIYCYELLNQIDHWTPIKGQPKFMHLLFETDQFPCHSLVTYENCVILLEEMFDHDCLDGYVDKTIEDPREALEPLMTELTDYFITNKIYAFIFEN